MRKDSFKSLIDNFYFLINRSWNKSPETIVAEDTHHLKKLINEEMNLYGNNCNLNHIDVSNITDMSKLFLHSKFNGDISQWNVSKVKKMSYMFNNSNFNGNISNWDVSSVEDMAGMFDHSQFNGDISNWNVCKVETMGMMFNYSKFNGDVSKWDVSNVTNMNYMFCKSSFSNDTSAWTPYSLIDSHHMFIYCIAPIPYWKEYVNKDERNKIISAHDLNRRLDKKDCLSKRIKI